MLIHKFQTLLAFIKDWKNQSIYLKWMLEKTKPFFKRLMLIFTLNLLILVASVSGTIITKYIIDGVTGSGKNFTTVGILCLISLSAISIGINAYSGIITTYINEKYAFSIRSKVYDNILHATWTKIREFHSGDINTRLTSDINSVAGGISSIIPDLFFFLIELIISFCVLFYYDHFLALASLVIGPVEVLLSLIFSSKLKQYQVELNQAESEYRAFLQETVENISIVKTFTQENACGITLNSFRDKRLGIVMKRNKLNMAMNLCIRSIFTLGYLLAFGWSIYRLSTGSITYGTMTVFISLVSQVQAPIINLGSMIPQFITVLASVGRILEIDHIETEGTEEPVIHSTTNDIGLKIQNVTFGYNSDIVLDNVCLEIKPKELVGIVGYSGSGKTTLAYLILSLLSPDSGYIEFYGNDGLTEKASASSRRFISYVPQGNTLFSGTIAENLRTGKQDATEEEMWHALDIADAYSFIKGLNKGLNTIIGENGMGLSEGQAQRLAIARAVIKAAPIMILDEATSALDINTEEKVVERLYLSGLMHTCIIITHRRSMLAHCTRAIEIDNKKVMEISLSQ